MTSAFVRNLSINIHADVGPIQSDTSDVNMDLRHNAKIVTHQTRPRQRARRQKKLIKAKDTTDKTNTSKTVFKVK
jgi:hypothetical protein